MYNKLISIIIPTYNPSIEKYKRCLDSVLHQTYKNIEVIIVDDGSDQSIKNFFKRINDNRVRIYSQKNSGVSVARNVGIEEAKGDYVTFVDADDCIDKNWLSHSIPFLAKKYDIIFGRVISTDEHSLKTKMMEKSIDESKIYDKSSIIKVQKMLLVGNTGTPILHGMSHIDFGPYAKLFKRHTIIDQRFPVGLALGEDQVFTHTIVRKSKKIIVTNYKAYYYIENPKSVSHSYRKDALEIMMKSMRLIYDQLISKDEINDFYYAVILNASIVLPLQLKSNILYNFKEIKRIYKINSFPLYDAVRKIKIFSITGKKNKGRAFIYKYHLVFFNYLRQTFFRRK